MLWFTDFEEAKREAEAQSHTPRGATLSPNPHDRLLPPKVKKGQPDAEAAKGYIYGGVSI